MKLTKSFDNELLASTKT